MDEGEILSGGNYVRTELWLSRLCVKAAYECSDSLPFNDKGRKFHKSDSVPNGFHGSTAFRAQRPQFTQHWL